MWKMLRRLFAGTRPAPAAAHEEPSARYVFAHRHLRALAFEEGLASRTADEARAILQAILLQLDPDAGSVACARVVIAGRDALLVVPPARRWTGECVAALLSDCKTGDTRFLTYELAHDATSAVLCEWTREGRHVLVGPRGEPSWRAFVSFVEERLRR